jgi:hypothetical protein
MNKFPKTSTTLSHRALWSLSRAETTNKACQTRVQPTKTLTGSCSVRKIRFNQLAHIIINALL